MIIQLICGIYYCQINIAYRGLRLEEFRDRIAETDVIVKLTER